MFSLPVDLPHTLIGDPLRLGQVLGNLAGNAVKFTEQGHIVIAVEQEAPMQNGMIPLTFSVSDTGIGMSSEQVGRVLKAFSQADSSISRKYGGTGLGLSIVTRLLELMDAKLVVESEPGKGSRFSFTVRMPVVDEQPLKRDVMPADLVGLRVLVVDDNDAAREILNTMLASFSLRVTTLDSGVAAIVEIRKGVADNDPYQLVFMDWKMPEMDGFETIRRIRSDDSITQPPAIIMVTAFGREELRQQLKKLENTAFITKPVQPSTLFNTVLELFGKENYFPTRDMKRYSSQIADLKLIRGSRVLVVEDNLINQQVAREIIEQAGIRVEISGDTRKTIEAIESGEEFDAVFMDIQMPEMDGYEATRLIRRTRSFADLPIIAMTAHAMAGEREKCLAAGMNDHVAKPIDPRVLYASLIRWIPPRSSGTSTTSSTELIGDTDAFPVSLPALDIKDGLLRVGGNALLFRQILSDFKEQNLNTINNISVAIRNKELVLAKSLVHSFKGLSGTIGAKQLSETIRRFETMLREENSTAYPSLLMTMEQQAREVFENIKKLETMDDGISREMPSRLLSAEELEPLLKGLNEALLSNDLSASKLFKRLNPLLLPSPDKDEVQKYIDRLDFENALKKLSIIAMKNGIEL
jgi:CheY-like chemotaxis protein/HPt (histidine-containing phosphotransfer) domain-containing protein